MNQSKAPLSLKESFSLVDQIVDLCGEDPWIVLGGGEPTIRPDLKELLEYINTKEFYYKAILTNATLITKEMAKWLVRLTTRIQVSLEGATAEVNDAVRGKGSFEKAITGIKNLLEFGSNISMRMTYSIQPREEVAKMMKLARDLGIKEFDFRRVTPVVDTRSFSLLQTFTDAGKDYQELCEMVWNLKDEYKLDVEFGDPFTMLLTNPEREKIALNNRKLMSGEMIGGCSVGTDSIYIDPWGRVLICPYLPIYCGDVHEQSLEKIWFSSKAFRLFRSIRHNLEGKCAKCKFKFACGGCRAAAYAMTGNVCGEDPRCWYKI